MRRKRYHTNNRIVQQSTTTGGSLRSILCWGRREWRKNIAECIWQTSMWVEDCDHNMSTEPTVISFLNEMIFCKGRKSHDSIWKRLLDCMSGRKNFKTKRKRKKETHSIPCMFLLSTHLREWRCFRWRWKYRFKQKTSISGWWQD